MGTTTQERYESACDLLYRERRFWDPVHAGVREKVSFLIDGQHYDDDDEGAFSKNSRSIRWVGQESFHVHRHEIGVVVEHGALNARPVDDHGTQDLAELATALMESATQRPEDEFEDSMYDVVAAASAAGYGVAWLDHLPNAGPVGRVMSCADDPCNFMFDARARSVHSPRCRYVIRKFRMTLAEAKRRTKGKGGWKKSVVDKLVPDSDPDASVLIRQSSATPKIGGGDTVEPRDLDEREFTGYMIYYRNPDDTAERSRDFQEYEPGERYLRCYDCGYRTESQDRLNAQRPEGQDEQTLPEKLEGGCPQLGCPGDLQRVDGEEYKDQLLAYPEGKLQIIAPYCGLKEFLYEGQTPFRTRSFPCMFLPRFRHPFRPFGPSLADLNWWNQIATDMLMRIVLERMADSSPIWIMPVDGYEDINGQPFERSDENGLIARYRGNSTPGPMELVGGDAGIPTAWGPIYQAARQALTSHTGTFDFGASDAKSRDIPASSIAQQIQQEEIPVADFKRRYQRQLSIYIGVMYDMLREMGDSEQMHRVPATDGTDEMRTFSLADLPNFEFIYSDAPEFKARDEAQRQATSDLIAAIQTTPWAVDLIAAAGKYPPSLVRKAKQDYQAFVAQQQQAAAMAQQQAAGARDPAAGVGAAGAGPAVSDSPASMVDRLLADLPQAGAQHQGAFHG